MRHRIELLFYAVLAVSFSLLSTFAAAQQCVVNPPGQCGDPLGVPYRSVVARSNAPWQASPTGNSCGGETSCTYGLHYQCVEFIRRFHATNDGPNVWNRNNVWPVVGNASDYFRNAAKLGLEAISNGDQRQPQPDDILVFDKARAIGDKFGHVAIVTSVTGTNTRIVEQNSNASGYKDLPRDTEKTGYFLKQRGSYPILGWMRKVSVAQPIVYQPANDIGVQDIWTTSVFSFTGLGGGPGGGLNDDRLIVGGWGDLYYSLIAFNLNTLPTTASKVELQLYMPQARAAGTTALYLDRITTFWDWRTQGTGQDRLRLWWIDRPTAEQWIATALPAPIAGQWYTIDITTLYNGWKAGTYPNYGIQLRPVGAGNNTWADFVSSNSADAAHHPRLVVTP